MRGMTGARREQVGRRPHSGAAGRGSSFSPRVLCHSAPPGRYASGKPDVPGIVRTERSDDTRGEVVEADGFRGEVSDRGC